MKTSIPQNEKVEEKCQGIIIFPLKTKNNNNNFGN